jgi:hypothetical protein
MDNSFDIEVQLQEKTYSFQGRLEAAGYTHRFHVLINGLEVMYEPDEERNYRAIINPADQHKIREIDMELIKLVGEKIQSIGE